MSSNLHFLIVAQSNDKWTIFAGHPLPSLYHVHLQWALQQSTPALPESRHFEMFYWPFWCSAWTWIFPLFANLVWMRHRDPRPGCNIPSRKLAFYLGLVHGFAPIITFITICCVTYFQFHLSHYYFFFSVTNVIGNTEQQKCFKHKSNTNHSFSPMHLVINLLD